jgi:hypothetical protein
MIVAEIDGLRCGRRISTTYQASMLDGPPIRLSLHDRLGACLGISIQVTSMDDQSVQIASIRPQCSFAPIPAA